MQRRPLVVPVLFLLLLALSLLGAPAWADAPPDTLAFVHAHGELRWGADSQGGAPYVFQDPMDPNHLVGFEVDLADALGKKLGVRARPVQGQWDGLLDLLARGDFDMAMNGLEVAEEKRRVAELSRPYYATAEHLTVRRGRSRPRPRTLEALRGRRVGTLPSSLAERILRRAGADVKTYDGGQNDIFDDLRIGRTDAVLMDDPVTLYYGAIDPALERVDGHPSASSSTPSPCARAIPPCCEAVNDALGELAADGTLGRIYARWGLWNEETARLLGGPRPAASAMGEAFESWRAAVGKPLPFWERVATRYPATLGLFATGAAVTLAVSLLAMALAVALGLLLALARGYGPAPAAVARGWLRRALPRHAAAHPAHHDLLRPARARRHAPPVRRRRARARAQLRRRRGRELPRRPGERARRRSSTPRAPSASPRGRRCATSSGRRRSASPSRRRPTTSSRSSRTARSISVVTLTELTKTYTSLAAAMRDHLGLGALVALFYLALSLPFARLSRWVEARLGAHLRRASERSVPCRFASSIWRSATPAAARPRCAASPSTSPRARWPASSARAAPARPRSCAASSGSIPSTAAPSRSTAPPSSPDPSRAGAGCSGGWGWCSSRSSCSPTSRCSTTARSLPCAPAGRRRTRAEARALELLDQLGLADKADAFPEELSGGQRQRVAIARALAMEPRVLLYDEPTSALDPSLKQEVGRSLRRVAETGITQIMVTHDLGVAREASDLVFVLEAGRVARSGSPAEVLRPGDAA